MSETKFTTEQMEEIHPLVPGLVDQLKQGRSSRREFLRTVTLLGASLGTAQLLAACGAGTVNVGESAAEPAAESASSSDSSSEMAGGIKRGGVMRTGTSVKAIDHPARFSWIFDSNQFRHVFEYLTETGSDNVTRPYLLESWTPNEDLTVWDLKLREGIMWTNGDELVAEHVKFNFGEWLNPDTGSSILGLWEGFLDMDGIEIVDDYNIRLNLQAPLLAVPENMFHYPAQIMHPSFDGDITSGNNPSTGPMVPKEFVVGERVVLERRDDYWQMGADGEPLPYLDGMEFIDLGDDQTAAVAALQSGDIDRIYDVSPDSFLALKGNDSITVEGVGTAATRVLRFRVDTEPWDNQSVVNAVKMCQDRSAILASAYFGEGLEGYDTHVSPVQPEWAPMDLPAYDPEGAKALLAEAYWDLWKETAVGITTWAHRPLAVMLLPLAYINDSSGEPVAWNETRWHDEEFATLLQEAQGTADVEARRALMADIQRIQQERGSIGVAYFVNRWATYNPGFQGVVAHPTDYNLYREVWYDPDQDTLRG